MVRSRVTLATTEAAAIEKLSASPLTTVFTAHDSGGATLPSTSAMSGRSPSAVTARAIATRLARRMLIWSISPRLAAPTPMRTAPIRALKQRAITALAQLAAQHLRIIERAAQLAAKAPAIDDDRRGDDRPRQRSPPRLVDAADDPRAAALDGEIRHGLLAASPGPLVPLPCRGGNADLVE